MAMKSHNILVGDELWSRASGRAADEGTTLSALIRQWLEDYVDAGHVGEQPKVRLSAAQRDAVHEALSGLDIAGIVIDTVNKER